MSGVSNGGRARKRALTAAAAVAGLLVTPAAADAQERRPLPVHATDGCVTVHAYMHVPMRIDTRRELESWWRVSGRRVNVAAHSIYSPPAGIGVQYPACVEGDRVFVVYDRQTREWLFTDYAEPEFSQ